MPDSGVFCFCSDVDAEESHRRLVALCVDQIDPIPPSPTRGEKALAVWRFEAERKAELVINIVRRWDRGERF